jgi:hypothetical protein
MANKMDYVSLRFVTTANVVYVTFPREYAGQIMQGWHAAREAVRFKKEGWEKDQEYLTKGTIIGSVPYKDDIKDSYCLFTVAVKSIVGMYISEIEKSPQDRIAEAMEREMKKGNEWKEGDE